MTENTQTDERPVTQGSPQETQGNSLVASPNLLFRKGQIISLQFTFAGYSRLIKSYLN